MPLNSTTFLTTQGWEGVGVPLDGKGGTGLKKPLAIPQKRGLKGLGKERDRAVEWWDCLFETSAKTLNIALPSSSKLPVQITNTGPASTTSSRPTTIPTASAKPAAFPSSSASANTRISMQSAAKREYARRVLMSSFVRGRPEIHPKPKIVAEEKDQQSTSLLAVKSTVDECGKMVLPHIRGSSDPDQEDGKAKGRIECAAEKELKGDKEEKKKKKKRKSKGSKSEQADSRSSSKRVDDELIRSSKRRKKSDQEGEAASMKGKKVKKEVAKISDDKQTPSLPLDAKPKLNKEQRRAEKAEKKARKQARATRKAARAVEVTVSSLAPCQALAATD